MKKPAIFLDRDGTINKEVDYLRNLEQLRILPGVARAIRTLNEAKFLVIVVTNQPVIARGWATEEQVRYLNEEIGKRLSKQGARIDKFYFCPHHPEANLKKYRIKCHCRKPRIGLIKKAVVEFNISLEKSYIVGDSTRDIQAGRNAKMKTILVKTGCAGKDNKFAVTADFETKNLLDAVKIIRGNNRNHGK